MKILIADDHRLIVDELIIMIKEIIPDADCVGTSESKSILGLYEKYDFDVAFLDIELDDINGIALAEKILLHHPRTNIIYITGYEKYALESYRTYASAFLVKPVDDDMLRDALSHLRFPVSSITDEMLRSQNAGLPMIGARIRKFREERGMTRAELADALGCVMPTIQRWESGTRIPDIPMFMSIAKVLGVTMDDLINCSG